MFKHLQWKLYGWLIMRTQFPKLRMFFLRILHYILYPEFRSTEYEIIKKIKRIFVGSFVVVFILMLIEIMAFEGRIQHMYSKLVKAQKENIVLRNNAETLLYKSILDSVRSSAEYCRYHAYNTTGILIPGKVSDKHVICMVKTAEKLDIPLRILLGLIERESNFDSIASNDSSSAWGYMQTINSTFANYYIKLKLQDGRTSENNIKAGAQLLRDGFDYWIKKKDEEESWKMSLACYTLGDSLPRALGVVPESTREYIQYIMRKR